MAFSTQLIDNLTRYQPQKPNHFDATFGIPQLSGGVKVIRFNPLSISYGLIQSFTTPTREFEVKEFSYYGIKRKIPIRRKYGQLSLSFLLDDFLAISGWIEFWMDLIVNPFSDYVEDYNPTISQGFISLVPTDINFNSGGSWTFFETYPVQILPIDFDMTKRNESLRYTVLFNCTEYIFEGANYTTSSKAPQE